MKIEKIISLEMSEEEKFNYFLSVAFEFFSTKPYLEKVNITITKDYGNRVLITDNVSGKFYLERC